MFYGKKSVNFSAAFLFFFGLPLMVYGATLNIAEDVLTYSSLSDTTVYMSGVSELHITATSNPIPNCVIHLNSADSFFFLEGIKPSVAASTYLSQIQVSGAPAVLDTNVRVVQYADGAVIIPHASTFAPLQVFDGENFTGNSMYLTQYTAYDASLLGSMANNIRSFILKRGYTATLAQNENGTGYSKNYVAQDCDLEIGVLPAKFNNQISFVRIFPWRWISKKGIAGNIGSNLNIKWWYNWNIDQNSTLDKEYVPIRQTRWWPGLGQDWQARGASHLLGYNEPDSTSQSNIAVGDAIWSWPDLLATGLRVGSPATTDGGRSSWLYPFIQQADAADLRVDFVAVHYYWCYDPTNPSGAATQMYNFLKEVYDNTGRPIWVTEWNNGANWTGCADPTYTQQRDCIAAMLNMLDSTPFVERYALYNWVEDVRRVEWDDGSLTEAGVVYRDKVSPIGYRQEVPASGKTAQAMYYFDDNFRDVSGNGNHPLIYGAPKRATGQIGNALVLDGVNDYLILPANMGRCTDFTFGAWIYWNGGNNWQRIFDFGNDTNQYMFLTPRSGSSTLRFAIKNGGSEQLVETTGLTAGVWTHVAVTLQGTTASLYVNGVLAATNSAVTINPSAYNSKLNYLGKSQFSADPLFSGKLDEVYVADYALTSAQIVDLMNDTLSEPPLLSWAMPVTASSYQTGNVPANGNDGDAGTTRWTAADSTYPQWWRVDLGTVQSIGKAVIFWYGDTDRSYKYRIEISNDDSSYTTLIDQTGRTATGTSIDTFDVSARFVRVTVTGVSPSGGWAGFWECRIYGPTSQPCTPTTITPYTQIDGGSWVQTASATVNVGQTVKFGPQPVTGGSWSWSGPNGFSATTREITLSNIQTSQAGTYTATYTNDCGAQSQQAHTVTVNTVAPAFVAAGSVTSGTGTVTPALPSGIASGDILLLFVETANQEVSISNSNGGTWAAVTNSPQGTGTAGGTSATRLTAFWSRYNGTQGAPTVSDSGNHQLARMIAIRGAVSSGNPWDVTAGGVESTADTSGSIAGTTTTVANTLVVVAIATSLPDSTSTTRFSSWTNANLTSLTERTDNSVTAGNGGGLGIATGVKAAAGAYGNTSVTLASSAAKGMMSIAIKP